MVNFKPVSYVQGKQAARTSLLDCCSNGAVSFEVSCADTQALFKELR